ncbi:PP0621 family protein [Sulfurovum sp.]|uniref:PP0621 family protein n=1 Tax=Sulfurovum sp. TaxID=1969726 RepID=UPI00286830D7|nr:PP0621 family protein [Sulfurovum sp.]
MILKLLVFAIVGVIIYKFFGGKFPKIGKTAHEKKLDDDTLVECEKCNTYVTVKESMIVNGKYYCSAECTP